MDINYTDIIRGTGLTYVDSPYITYIVWRLVPYFFTVAGILLLLYLLWGGIALMLAKGDPKAIQLAQAKITGALTGFLIVFLSYWIVQIVGLVLGIVKITSIFS